MIGLMEKEDLDACGVDASEIYYLES